MAILQFSQVAWEGSFANYENMRPQEWQCAPSIFTNTYNVTVTNGVTSPAIISSWNDGGIPHPVINDLSSYYTTRKALLKVKPDSVAEEISITNYLMDAATIAEVASYLNRTLNGTHRLPNTT